MRESELEMTVGGDEGTSVIILMLKGESVYYRLRCSRFQDRPLLAKL